MIKGLLIPLLNNIQYILIVVVFLSSIFIANKFKENNNFIKQKIEYVNIDFRQCFILDSTTYLLIFKEDGSNNYIYKVIDKRYGCNFEKNIGTKILKVPKITTANNSIEYDIEQFICY